MYRATQLPSEGVSVFVHGPAERMTFKELPIFCIHDWILYGTKLLEKISKISQIT